MNRIFKVIGNSRFDHNFEVGQLLELVRVYPDGVFEVKGKLLFSEIKQDMHPCDLKEIF